MFVFVMLSCQLIAALWSPAGKKANILALLYVVFSCVFDTCPCGALGRVQVIDCIDSSSLHSYLFKMIFLKCVTKAVVECAAFSEMTYRYRFN